MVTQKEALSIPDLLQCCATQIEKLGFQAGECEDPELRRILENHQRSEMRAYDTLLHFLQGADAEQPRAAQGPMVQPEPGPAGWAATGPQGLREPIAGDPWTAQDPGRGFEPMRPQAHPRRLSDRAIAADRLDACKLSALTLTFAALEAATWPLRNALAALVQEQIAMAYDVFVHMNQRGWYRVPVANQPMMQPIQQGFQPVGRGPAPAPAPAGPENRQPFAPEPIGAR